MLHLPFFEDRHRELAVRLRTIVETHVEPGAAAAEEGDVDEAGRAAIRLFAREGLLAFLLPDTSRGRDLPDLRSVCLVREALASASGLADSVFAVHGLGSFPVFAWGTANQKRRYLARLGAGDLTGAFALTEPNAGSDIASLETTAVRDGDDYVLNGRKTFISNAGIAGLYVVFAALPADASHAGRRPLVSLLVDAGTPGLSVSSGMRLMAPHPIGDVVLRDCRVPATQRLGGERDGMKVALSTLDFFRTTVGAAACGMASRALSDAVQRARSRRQFGAALSEFQATRLALADMRTELDAARLLVYRAAWVKDEGADRVTLEAATAKLYATEAAQRIIDRAVQIHGGLGVTKGVAVERLYREIRALRIYEGTSEIQRLVIAKQLLDAE